MSGWERYELEYVARSELEQRFSVLVYDEDVMNVRKTILFSVTTDVIRSH